MEMSAILAGDYGITIKVSPDRANLKNNKNDFQNTKTKSLFSWKVKE